MQHEDFYEMVDALMADDGDAATDQRARFQTGCNADDTTDSRGEKLRPRYNEGGEPYWM